MKRRFALLLVIITLFNVLPVQAIAEQLQTDTVQPSVENANASNSRAVNATPWDGTIATGFARGNGSLENPYIIETASQLAYLAKSVNAGTTYHGKYIDLIEDIDLAKNEWTAIGAGQTNSAFSSKEFFSGTFDGNGHSIVGLKQTKKTLDWYTVYHGLFGSNKGTISNLNVIEADISNETITTPPNKTGKKYQFVDVIAVIQDVNFDQPKDDAPKKQLPWYKRIFSRIFRRKK